jgi:hypothetical protein
MSALRAGLAAVSAFAVVYLLCGTLQLPIPFYDPLRGAFAFARARPSPWMRYYGDLLYALCAGLLAFGIARALPEGKTKVAVATGAALSLVALDVLFYLSRLLASV